jgi:aminopeptidase
MIDPRITKLADTLVNYSCAVKPGEKLLMEAIDVPTPFATEVVRLTREAGGHPLVMIKSNQVNRALMRNATEEQWNLIADVERLQMENVQCYIGARGSHNVSELSDVPAEKQRIFEQTVWKRVHGEVRVPKTRWVVLRWPNPEHGATRGDVDRQFRGLLLRRLHNELREDGHRAMEKPLKARMERTDRVHLKGPGDTDLTFSIKGIPAIPCAGKLNIPDGEVFTAPVKRQRSTASSSSTRRRSTAARRTTNIRLGLPRGQDRRGHELQHREAQRGSRCRRGRPLRRRVRHRRQSVRHARDEGHAV